MREASTKIVSRQWKKQLSMIVNEWTLMDGKYLLDTNIIIALFAGDKSILAKLAQVDEIFISSTVIGE